jgi:hypothetical protein
MQYMNNDVWDQCDALSKTSMPLWFAGGWWQLCMVSIAVETLDLLQYVSWFSVIEENSWIFCIEYAQHNRDICEIGQQMPLEKGKQVKRVYHKLVTTFMT